MHLGSLKENVKQISFTLLEHFYITSVTDKLEACTQAVDLSVLPPAISWYLLIRLGEPEHVDFKENLFKALTQVTKAAPA